MSHSAEPSSAAAPAPALRRYHLRFAAEALWAGWRRCWPRLCRRGQRLLAQAALRLAAASVLLLPVLAASPRIAAAGALTPGVHRRDPRFAAPSDNPFGLSLVGPYSAPVFADIDGDGDLDAFVGRRDGRTAFFRNTGSVTRPAFAALSLDPFGLSTVTSAAVPAFVDIDADGDLDAFIGNAAGHLIFRRNTGSVVQPVFAASSDNPFGLVLSDSYAYVAFADLDGDGDMDALVGSGSGHMGYFRNSGSATGPAFAAQTADPFDLPDIGYNATPALADLDGDGDLDAYVGEAYGHVAFFQNSGSAIGPAFGPRSDDPFGLTDVEWYSAPNFADIDADGDLDAFVGSNNGDIAFFRNTGSVRPVVAVATSSNAFGLSDLGDNKALNLVDLDADGDLDAFEGEYFGFAMYQQNTGTAIAPAFSGRVEDPYGLGDIGQNSSPCFVDIDADGDLDSFIGELEGDVVFRQNTGTAVTPAFTSSTANPFGLVNVGWFNAPAFVDIDGDGDLDALLGNNFGDTLFQRNTGTAVNPAFAASSTNPFGLSDVGIYSTPAFVDIDGDGDLDGFSGNKDGATVFFLNTGSAANPAFATSSLDPFGLTDIGARSTPEFADLDADGDPDAVVGDQTGSVTVFEFAPRQLMFPLAQVN